MCRRVAGELSLRLNDAKTRIEPVKGTKITFLKRVYSYRPQKCAGAGGLEIVMASSAVRATRRHIKGITHLAQLSILSEKDLQQVIASLHSHVASVSHPTRLFSKFARETGVACAE